jgi:hypothetical protein
MMGKSEAKMKVTSRIAALALVGIGALGFVGAAGSARADGNDDADKDAQTFEVKVTKGEVEIIAKGDWHINKDFPWKLVVGDARLDRSRFELDEKTARVTGVPHGVGKLRGALCSKDVCRTLERELTIP